MRALVTVLTLCALAARAENEDAPKASSPPLVETIVLYDKGNRVRWGISAEGGSTVAWGGVVLRVEGRFGYQVSRKFGVYGLLGVGGSVGSMNGGLLDFGAVAEFTLVDWFYFGGGLVASYGAMNGYAGDSGARYFSEGYSGVFRPAVDLRFGFSTGKSEPPYFSRGGFNVGLHTLLSFHPDMRVTNYNTGFSNQSAAAPSWMFAPMISVGFDFR